MLTAAFIITLLVQAIWYTMQDGEIFGKLGNWLYMHLPEKIHSPIFDCPVCMTPWYGSGMYFLLFVNGSAPWWHVFPTVICAMGMQVVISKLSPPKDADND